MIILEAPPIAKSIATWCPIPDEAPVMDHNFSSKFFLKCVPFRQCYQLVLSINIVILLSRGTWPFTSIESVNEYIQGLIQFDYVILSHVCSNCVQIDNSDILTIFFILRETF